MDEIINKFEKIHLNDVKHIIKIQSWFRGVIFRRKRLPNILYYIKNHIDKIQYNLQNDTSDGRINSLLNENVIINIVKSKFNIKIPKKRMWYDLLVYDFYTGWIPVNIKITTCKTYDNVGNLAVCVWAYTNTDLDFDTFNNNGKMSLILIDKLKNKEYNNICKKDYYFLVINKINKNIIINSINGLSEIRPNINNLPFQICWEKNKEYKYKNIKKSVEQFIKCLKQYKKSWKEEFINNINLL